MALLLGFTALLHAGSLTNFFILDDFIYVSDVHLLTWQELPKLFTLSTLSESSSGVWWTPLGQLPFYRPVAVLLFAIDHAVWGLNPVGYHLTNLLLHLICTLLVWRIARKLLENESAALAAATLFAVHPGHGETLLWTSGRFDLMSCLFVCSSVLAWLNWRETEGRNLLWLLTALGFFGISLLCKENAIVLPALFLVWEWLDRRRGDQSVTVARAGAVIAAFGAVAGSYLFIRFGLFGGVGKLPPPYGVELGTAAGLGQLLLNLAQYAMDVVLFVHADAVYANNIWATHLGLLLIPLGLILAILVAGWRVAGRELGFRLGLIWTVFFLAPSLPVMVGERNLYLSLAGFCLSAGCVWKCLATRRRERGLPFRPLRAWAVTIVAVASVILIGEQVIAKRVSNGSEKIRTDIVTLVPDPPPGARIYVLNQSPLSAVGFVQSVRLKYGRDDIDAVALSLTSDLESEEHDVLYRSGPNSLVLVREGRPLFDSWLDRFFLFGATPEDLVQSAERYHMRLAENPTNLSDLRRLEFIFTEPIHFHGTH